LGKAINEVAEVAKANQIHGHVSHIFSIPWLGPLQKPALKVLKWLARNAEITEKVIPGFVIEAEMKNILKMLDKERANGANITMDVMPTTAGFTHLMAFFPPWALTGGKDQILGRVKDPKTRAEILKDIETGKPTWPHRGRNDWSLNIMKQMGWDAVTVMAVHEEKNKHLEGKLFTEIAEETGKHPFDVMCDLLIEEDGRVLVFESMSEPDDAFTEHYTFPALQDKQTMITTDTILLGMGTPSYLFYGCYPKFIHRYVFEKNLLDLPTAISRCTSLPAKEFNIKNRGLIKEGCFADILVMDAENFKTKAVFRNPAQDPEGMKMVLINGKVVVEDGQVKTGVLSGKMLRRDKQDTPSV
jgi:N-acyl-D-aspartate/D-glutamate deacylase